VIEPSCANGDEVAISYSLPNISYTYNIGDIALVIPVIYSVNHVTCEEIDITVTVVDENGVDISSYINYAALNKELTVYSDKNTNTGTYTLAWTFYIDSYNQETVYMDIILVSTCIGEIGTITMVKLILNSPIV
jgi:hypothetical protein